MQRTVGQFPLVQIDHIGRIIYITVAAEVIKNDLGDRDLMHRLRITSCKNFNAQRLPHAFIENSGLCSPMRTKALIFFIRNKLSLSIGKLMLIMVIVVHIISKRHIPRCIPLIFLIEISKARPFLFKAGNAFLSQRGNINSCRPERLSGIVHKSPCIIIEFTISISRACKGEQGE